MKNQNTAYRFVLIGTPVAVSFILLMVFLIEGFYPFGNGSISWCDMDQQVIPLLLSFKRIITGSESMLYSFHAAGGMNFWGVFFFFISSPVHLILLLVPDARMLEFMNVLTILKMALCGLTACIYLIRHQHRPMYCFLFALLYAFSGYSLFFYQNTIWLDMAALFPLLMLSFEHLAARHQVRYYIFCMSAMMVLCYYIEYMVVVFTLLYFGVLALTLNPENRKTVLSRFLAGSLAAACLTCVVWLPSILQFLSSGRGTSILSTLADKTLFTHIQTTLPILFPSMMALAAICYGIVHTPLKKGLIKNYLFLLFLMLIPVFIEPVNTMWHTGNYMSFPVRYGFILLFLMIILGAYYLEKAVPAEKPKDQVQETVIFAALLLLSVTSCLLSHLVVNAQITVLSSYTHHLWGNSNSLQLLSLLALLEFPVFLLLIRCLNRNTIRPLYFVILCLVLLVHSFWNNIQIYMISADTDEHVYQYQQFTDLENFRPDEEKIAEGASPDFYRVKMRQKYYHANSLAALGFNTLGHYTSLTSQSYMFAMKNLGYSSYWMEVGGYGGTVLTDAYMAVAYQVEWADGMKSEYANNTYKVVRKPVVLPMGIASEESSSDTNHLERLSRFEVQELLWHKLFPHAEPALKSYSPSVERDINIAHAGGEYQLRQNLTDTHGHLIYQIQFDEPAYLYFDCFDELTNHLSEPIYNAFRITVDNKIIYSSYPTSINNGLVELGLFSNEMVEVDIELLKPVNCRSFGLFSLQMNQLQQAAKECEALGFKKTSNRSLSAVSSFEEDKTIFMSLPYDEGLTLKIDNKKAPLTESFDGFVSFRLPAGNHEISISFMPVGLIPGLIVSLAALVLLLCSLLIPAMHRIYERITENPTLDSISVVVTIGVFFFVFFMIYVFPMLICLLQQIDQTLFV